MTKINYYDLKIKNCSLQNLILDIFKQIQNKKKSIYTFANPHSLVVASYDKNFYSALNKSNILIDGVGFQLMLFLKNRKKIFRNPGYEVFLKIIESFKTKKFFFLGSNNETLKKIKKKLVTDYSVISKNIQYLSPPFADNFSLETEKKLKKRINKFNPDFIFIGMTAPKQEKWIHKNFDQLKFKICLPIGAVFNYFSNNIPNPPKMIRYLGFEWLYRLILEPRLWSRTFISFPYFILLNLSKRIYKFDIQHIKIYQNIHNLIKNKKKYIISAFNLAFYSYLVKKKIKLNEDLYTWPDGITTKVFNYNINKISGSDLINKIKISKTIRNLHVIGNLHKKEEIFLKKKFKKPIVYTSLPLMKISDIQNLRLTVKESNFILLTIPTPKQEILAESIFKKNPNLNLKILCIGGGLAIASGLEKKCPNFLSKMGLEWVWRLRFQTRRRLFRLIETLSIFFMSFFSLPLKKIFLEKADEI